MEEQNTREQTPSYLIPAAIVSAGFLIAGAIIYSNIHTFPAQPAGEIVAGGVQDPAALSTLGQGGMVLGSPDAPVTLVEFADFQCPYCGRFNQAAGKDIVEKYVKTGKVKFVYRNFAFLGEESEFAAEAAQCANDQGKFWQYHDYLFDHQQGENDGAFAKVHLKEFARTLGLDSSRFDSCLDAGTHRPDVEKDTADGRTFGVQGTPAVFINGHVTTGALPFAQYQTLIEKELSAVAR